MSCSPAAPGSLRCCLLSGGDSRRMGRDKALLPHPEGGTWLERSLGLLAAGGGAQRRRDGGADRGSRIAGSWSPWAAIRTAMRWRYRYGRGLLAVVASVSTPVCGDCNRLRVTADGLAYSGLDARSGAGTASRRRGSPCGDGLLGRLRPAPIAPVLRSGRSEQLAGRQQHDQGQQTPQPGNREVMGTQAGPDEAGNEHRQHHPRQPGRKRR